MAECLSLGVRAPGEPALLEIENPPLTDGAAAVRTLFSGLSAGTELTYVKGTDPALTARRDPELGVFVPGGASRRYPILAMGYMEVAEVTESRRADLAEGTLVAAAYGHRSCHVLGAGDVVVPLEQSERYAAAARAAGDPVEVRVVPGDHMVLIDPAGESWRVVRDWLAGRRNAVGRRTTLEG